MPKLNKLEIVIPHNHTPPEEFIEVLEQAGNNMNTRYKYHMDIKYFNMLANTLKKKGLTKELYIGFNYTYQRAYLGTGVWAIYNEEREALCIAIKGNDLYRLDGIKVDLEEAIDFILYSPPSIKKLAA